MKPLDPLPENLEAVSSFDASTQQVNNSFVTPHRGLPRHFHTCLLSRLTPIPCPPTTPPRKALRFPIYHIHYPTGAAHIRSSWWPPSLVRSEDGYVVVVVPKDPDPPCEIARVLSNHRYHRLPVARDQGLQSWAAQLVRTTHLVRIVNERELGFGSP